MKTGKMNFPTEGPHWRDGILTIDGTEAQVLVQRCMARGLLTRGVEKYQRDGVPINKPNRPKKRA